MITRYQASLIANVLLEEARRVADMEKVTEEHRNLIVGIIVSAATVLEKLDSRGLFS